MNNNVTIQNILGDSNNAHMMMEVFKSASNVITSDNPEFTMCDFVSVFPVFIITDSNYNGIPSAVYNLFYNMANASIKYQRYHSNWKYCMCLYIAHYLTLYLQTQSGDPGAQSALAGALPRGVASSKSVDGLSISYDFMGAAEDLAGYGTWKYTIYGQQLASITKMYGHAGMWVNG
nr:MAG TPA: head to tail adaptor [Caudoviricetes sp.]